MVGKPLTPATFRALRLAGMGLAGTVVAGILLLRGFLVLLVLFAPNPAWQRPAVYRVTVEDTRRDSESVFTDYVSVLRDGRPRVLRMLQDEARALQAGEEILVLDNWFAIASRPPQYRLTLGRFLLEFPEPLLLLALAGLAWLGRLRPPDPPEPATPRRVLRDDFHERARRFGPEG